MKNKLPNFLIVGAAKSGTSSLHQYLIQHPEIFMSSVNLEGKSVKEPQFLIKDIVEKRLHFGVWSFEEYLSIFNGVKDEKLIGEASVFYLYYYREAIKNIKKILGSDIKIIILLRNPVDRAFSAYLHVSRSIKEPLSFEQALMEESGRLEKDVTLTPMVMYKDMGLYYDMVKSYKDNFKDVHVILYEDFRDRTNLVLQGIFDFLNVSRNTNIDYTKKYNIGGRKWNSNIIKNLFQKDNFFKRLFVKFIPKLLKNKIKTKLLKISTKKVTSMNNKTRENLISYFKKDIIKLSKLIGKDLKNWTK